MIKSKSSASSITVPSSYVIQLVNGAQFLDATRVISWFKVILLPLTKM